MKKKSLTSQAFQSIRIISKKAQAMVQKVKTDAEKPLPISGKSANANVTTITITPLSVVKAALSIVLVLILVWTIYKLRDKLLLFLLAMFIATIVDPGVNFLERWHIPRGIAIAAHYILAVFIILFSLVQIVPLIASQIQQIAFILSVSIQPFLENPTFTIPFIDPNSTTHMQISRLLQTTMQNLSIESFATTLQQIAGNFADVSEIARFATRVAGSVGRFFASLILVLVLGFFMQLEKERMIKWGRSFLPMQYRKYVDIKTEAIHTKIGQWMRGQLTLMASIFALTFVVLQIITMPYALTLALFAGLCEFFPAIGPLLAAVPAILIAGTQKGLIWVPIVAAVYYSIQWCENNLLVPIIMKRAVGLSPIAILFAMMIGISFPNTIHPILGVMMAVPVTTIIAIFLNDWRTRNG